jgi:hypothetical protein
MSRWYVTAIERLGPPNTLWPSVFGPAAGADPITANGLHTKDLTPYLLPLAEFSAQMERDLTGGSFSSIKLDLEDRDGTLADLLGPFSALMATSGRYYGPWIKVTERWGVSSSAQRFVGYLDETSLQWTADAKRTQATALHASQLLKERKITDYPELLRPWPSVPTNASQEFAQSTADALLDAAAPAYTPRVDAVALEAALWAVGQLSWIASTSELTVYRVTYHPDSDPTHGSSTTTYPVPTAPAASVIIGGTAYAVDHLEWDPINAEVVTGDPSMNGSIATKHPVRIVLQGAPDLTGHLHLGDTVTWGIPEAQRTHYLLNGSVITAPAAGSDGAKSIQLNTVEQLAAGDTLTLTFTDATSGTPRTATADLPTIIDLDGETGRVFFATALTQGYSHVSKVRRNSQDPVLFDGLAYARALVAPFALDTSTFVPAPTDTPVLVFRPYDAATPPLYGVHHLQTTNQAGALRAARRGSDNGLGAFPSAGIWSGAWGGAWSWQGLPSADATHQVLGDVLQFPGGVNAFTAPVIYIEGDLSDSAPTPPNGWRPAWRSWKALNQLSQDPESTWTGSAVAWAPTTATGDIPAKLVAFAASTATPGRYTRTSGGAWTFHPHTADATLGSASTPTLTGSLPSGNWLALGMGIWAPTSPAADEQEALLGLVATGSSYPFTEVKAVLLSQAAGGNLTLHQAVSLWATGTIPAGPWALGGGLVVQTWKQTIDGLDYPHTVLHKLNGSTVLTTDLKTLEVIPQTIQPLLRRGAAGSRVIGGWYALALETFADANYAPSRRLRFLHFDETLTLVNGIPEADPSTPTDRGAYFSRGEMVASIMPDGAILAKMVRTSNTVDEMAGLVGGRLFTVGNTLPTTVERLKLGATVPQGQILSIAHSGDGMTASAFLEKFAAAQLASAVPAADGTLCLVSRSDGTLRTRTIGAQKVGVQATEWGKRSVTQAWEGYLRKVRVTYTDLLAGSTASVEVNGSFDGGRILDLDLSDILASATMSVAIGRAAMTWMGRPVPVINETWTDRTLGKVGDQAPTFWADWRVGDRVPLTPYTPPATITTWKILQMTPAPEGRTVKVQLRKQPLTSPGE